MLIGLCGKSGSGKTLAAQHLVNKYGFARLSFAEPIKRMIGSLAFMLGYSGNEYAGILSGSKTDEITGTGCQLRFLLQTLGTEWGRNTVNERIWINVAKARLSELTCGLSRASNVVFDDVRFLNEVQWIRSLQHDRSRIVMIDRPIDPTSHIMCHASHCSENADLPVDSIIKNTGSIDEFRCLVDRIAYRGEQSCAE